MNAESYDKEIPIVSYRFLSFNINTLMMSRLAMKSDIGGWCIDSKSISNFWIICQFAENDFPTGACNQRRGSSLYAEISMEPPAWKPFEHWKFLSAVIQTITRDAGHNLAHCPGHRLWKKRCFKKALMPERILSGRVGKKAKVAVEKGLTATTSHLVIKNGSWSNFSYLSWNSTEVWTSLEVLIELNRIFRVVS